MCSRLPARLTSQAALMLFLPCVETNITSHTLGTTLRVQKKGCFQASLSFLPAKPIQGNPFLQNYHSRLVFTHITR